MRSVTVQSLAKINLDLRVLHKRSDGFHELRTVFQTVSLADTIEIEFTLSRKTAIAIDGNVDIPDNLIVRAAERVLEIARVHARVKFRLTKRIPMGGGLGGGSSNAAAVLLALPVLAGRRLTLETLTQIGADLGSDVPFFLHGGTMLGLGRGTELYPLEDAPARFGLIAASGIHVSTAEAYRALKRPELTGLTNIPAGLDTGNSGRNDFEEAVFGRHPLLKTIREQFRKLGARPAMMSGSGSAVYGLWPARELAAKAAAAFRGSEIALHRISLVSRRRYRALWLKQLREHTTGNLWPPQSRYAAR